MIHQQQISTLFPYTTLFRSSEEELHRIFGMYGEVQNAKTLARTIVSARAQEPIISIDQLKSFISKVAPRNKENKYYAQRSEEHTSELQSRPHLVCRLLLEKK